MTDMAQDKLTKTPPREMVRPVDPAVVEDFLREALTARFGADAVAKAAERRMWPKGRGI